MGSSVSDKGAVNQAEVVSQKKKGGCAGHCKKFWWAYLIGFIVIAVLVVVLIIFVAVPKIAQKKMDHAELTIDGITISNPEPEKYHMAVNSTIRTSGGIHAEIDPFEGIMYLTDVEPREVFATLNFPETSSVKELGVNVSQSIDVKDLAAFTRFNTWLLANETLSMTIEGKTKVHVKGLSKGYGVTFKKTVELKGINGFHGLEVTDAHVNITATTNNFKGTVDVPNASILTIEIGNATFRNFLDGKEIGTVYMDDLTLYPGINNVTIRADVDQAPVLTAITKKPACETGDVPLAMRGKDVVHSGKRLAYFADALAQLEQKVDIPLGAAFAELGMNLGCLGEKKDDDDEETDAPADEESTEEEPSEETPAAGDAPPSDTPADTPEGGAEPAPAK